jgi:hypothetical protein
MLLVVPFHHFPLAPRFVVIVICRKRQQQTMVVVQRDVRFLVMALIGGGEEVMGTKTRELKGR